MATKDKDGKLTYQMISPGDAWNNFVNSKEGHNASSVTPSYLEAVQKNPSLADRINERRQELEQQKEVTKSIDKTIDRGRE